jgi:hypothetical protein
MKNILISTPCGDTVHTAYTQSIVDNVLYIVSKKYDCAISYVPVLETYIHIGRIAIVNYAKSINATHIIWVDSDMFLPKHTFHQLLNHNLDFVGVNYSTRRSPHRFTASKWNENYKTFITIPTTETSSGLEEVDGIGFGCCITSIELFDKIEKPWFRYEYIDYHDRYRGEDYQFCLDIKPHTKIYVDHDISKEVLHMGTIGYNHHCPFVEQQHK